MRAALIATALTLLAAVACAPTSRSEVQPGTMSIEEYERSCDPGVLKRHGVRDMPDGTREHFEEVADIPPTRETHQLARSTGPAATASGERLQEGMTGAPADLRLASGARATGGGFELNADVSRLSKGPLLLVGGGVLCCCFAGFALYMGWRRPAVVAGVLGGLLITGGLFPVVAVVLLVLAVLAAAAWVIYEGRDGKGWKESLRATLAAAADLPAEARLEWEKRLGAHADPQDVARVRAVESADKLHDVVIAEART